METRSESSKSSSAEVLVTLAISLLLTQHQTAAVARMNQWTLWRLQLRQVEAGCRLSPDAEEDDPVLDPAAAVGQGQPPAQQPGRHHRSEADTAAHLQQQYSQH